MDWNSTMLDVRNFFHGIPRHSLYTFDEVSNKFDLNLRYFEGVMNFSALYLFFLLFSVVLVILSMLVSYLKLVSFSTMNVAIYKGILFIFGFISFASAVMALVGFTMLITKLGTVLHDFLLPMKSSLETLLSHVTHISNNVYSILDDVAASLSSTKTRSGNIIEDGVDSVINMATDAVTLSVVQGMQNTTTSTQMLINLLQDGVSFVKSVMLMFKLLFIFFVCYIFHTLVVSLWLFGSSFKSGGTGPCICRLSIITILLWWIIGATLAPFVFILSDICHEPIPIIARITHRMAPEIEEQLIIHYGTCAEPNPIQVYLDVLSALVTYVLTPPVETIVLALGYFADKDEAAALKNARQYLAHVLGVKGCVWSEQESSKAIHTLCTTFYLGLVTLAVAAAFIAGSMTFAVSACIRLRRFKGWPKKNQYPCPETCLIHRLPKRTPVEPCRPVIVEKPVKRKPVDYLRRRTCPITCRGFDVENAETDLRETCPKTCKGMIPENEKSKVLGEETGTARRRRPKRPKKDKGATCCIEVPDPVPTCFTKSDLCEQERKKKEKKKKEKKKKEKKSNKECTAECATKENPSETAKPKYPL